MTRARWGVEEGYEDTQGIWYETPAETRAAIEAALGEDGAEALGVDVMVVRPGMPTRLGGPAELTLEDGTVVRAEAALPRDLPLGYHRLRPLAGGREALLIASPGRCWLPEGLRAWGWAVQLYAARSATSWGIGDFGDLRRLARSSASLGAAFLLLNPMSAVAPVLAQQASPYFPSSRRYRNPLYLRVEEVPGAAGLGPDLDRLAEAGRALNRERRIDRDRVFVLKMGALERLWSRFADDAGFDRYCAEEGEALARYATFCALAEHHGAGWRRWPAEYRRPDGPAVARFALERAERVRFHQWLQWLLDEQLARAGAEVALFQDLPVGIDAEGADAWVWQDFLAFGVSVGAPPDLYNPRGQDWGLPPFVPGKLRAAAYGPFRETLRAALRHAGGLRLDHVMALFRLFWIPAGMEPRHGAYVRYPADELLAIVALESHRARAVIVGEDLGTVETHVRGRLAEHQILSSRVVWFETAPPADYPALSLASLTTHDLPTVVGLWTRSDLRAQRAAGREPNEAALEAIRARLRAMTGLRDDAPVGEVVLATHRLLAGARSALVIATLEDTLGVEERPNMPGTTADRWPSWCLALPLPIEELESHPLARAVAAALATRTRQER